MPFMVLWKRKCFRGFVRKRGQGCWPSSRVFALGPSQVHYLGHRLKCMYSQAFQAVQQMASSGMPHPLKGYPPWGSWYAARVLWHAAPRSQHAAWASQHAAPGPWHAAR